MFFEPVQVPDTIFETGFSQLPGGPNHTNLHALNDHSYGPCALGNLNQSMFALCNEYHAVKLSQREVDAKRLQVPLIISEFGACLGGETCITEITGLTEACDSQLASWAYWQFKKYGDLTTTAMTGNEGFYNEDGTLQEDKVKALTRTYVQAAQGTLQSVSFDSTSGSFVSSYLLDVSVIAPTVVFYSQDYWYEKGVAFTVKAGGKELDGGNDFTIDYSERNYVKILFEDATFHNQTITVSA